MTPGALSGSPRPLCECHDVGLLDLDGVIYLGVDPVPGAAVAVAAARAAGMAVAFVTNNAARSPEVVAAHLAVLGVPAQPTDVITSAMAVSRRLAADLPSGARVLVAGASGLAEAVAGAGFEVVETAEDEPAAVVLGYDPLIDYPRLAEASLAVGRGALWVAANEDATVPTPRGPLPGMGALVALIATATGRRPVVVGKPHPELHEECIRRTGARHPIVVGDRLDTDIEGANRSGTPSLLVLSGVTGPADLLSAPPARRPTYLALDLGGLVSTHPGATGGRCGAAMARLVDGTLIVTGDAAAPALDRLRAACSAAWVAADQGAPLPARWPELL
ncbi:MAG: HAD-IIA family hydrolase [Mycobacteriales bacterium]